MKVLVAEDSVTMGKYLEVILTHGGHQVVLAKDGVEAFEAFEKDTFDAVVTDWMMPRMDGIDLVRKVRGTGRAPAIMVVTTLDSDSARAHALEAGADDYLTKPFDEQQVLSRLGECCQRHQQAIPELTELEELPEIEIEGEDAPAAPWPVVLVAAGSGGPVAVGQVLGSLPAAFRGVVLVVLHGPDWVVRDVAEKLLARTHLTVRLARDGMPMEERSIYLAPAGRHLSVDGDLLQVRLLDLPAENYVRPSADVLFRSAAAAFGRSCVGVVLTGIGRDGALGARHVENAGGVVLVQDPATALAASMPQTAIDIGVPVGVVPIDGMADAIGHVAERL